MYSPTLRLLMVLELLEAKETMTGQDLARRLEVSLRSVQRYVVQLQDMGIPIESVRGVGGSYRLKKSPRLAPLVFHPHEALVVALGLQTLSSLGIGSAVARLGIEQKLANILPKPTATLLESVKQAVQHQTPKWSVPLEPETLFLLIEAALTQTSVRLEYTDVTQHSSLREIEPYQVVYHQHRWYVLGFCHLRQAIRSFRLDRMKNPVLTKTKFAAPQDFDALAFLEASLPFVPNTWLVEVVLHLPLLEAQRRTIHHNFSLEPREDKTLLRCGSNNLHWVAAVLLSVDCEFEILAPSELVTAFAALAKRCQIVGASHPHQTT
jgi:predicted DNA-binding transcriptional regulator YafY